MAVTSRDLYKLLDDVDYHARAIMRIHTEVRSLLAAVSIPDPSSEWDCPKCGAPTGGERTLALHMQNVHDGPAVPMSPEEEAAA